MKQILSLLLLGASSMAMAQPMADMQPDLDTHVEEPTELVTTEAPKPSKLEMLGKQALKDIKENTKFGGYVIGSAAFNDNEASNAQSNFSVRLIRLYVDGKVLDFQYKFQFQANGFGNDAKGNSPRVVDAWIEWQKFEFAKIKFGQFKRAFTFENPMNPWDIGAPGYSQLSSKFAGFSDRVGEHSSNGRDIGVQLQGDFLPIGKDKHNLFHYQFGVYNGQGINKADQNGRKDYIGGFFVRPIKELQLAVFGWNGNYSANGVTVDRKRLAYGLKYDGKINVRAEYARSHGRKIGTDANGLPAAVGADRADAWYAIVGVPVGEHWKFWGKYDVYRDNKEWDTTKSVYNLTVDYYFYKNLKIQGNYYYTHDRTAIDPDYNTFDLQVYFRF